MRQVRWWLFGIGLVAGCGDGTGPPAGQVPDGSLRAARWADQVVKNTYAVRSEPMVNGRGGTEGIPATPRFQVSANPVQVWAVKGETRSVEIDYVEADGNTRPFLVLTVPAGALDRSPTGKQYRTGDSVLIEITIDTVSLIAHLEPSGLQFSQVAPARLTMWYTGADGDLDADGDIDLVDSAIEAESLEIWYQEGSGDPWSVIPSSHDLVQKLYVLSLQHFSGYAISW